MSTTIKIFSLCLLAGSLLLSGIAVKPAYAGVIDRIQISQAGDEAEIQIRFVTRVQYLRQASLKNGDIRLYFDLLEIDALDSRLIFEKAKSPPSNIVPRFTITYPELDSSLSISFGKSVDYYVRPGKDGRSISLLMPINTSQVQANAPLEASVAPPQAASTGTLKPAAPPGTAEIKSVEPEAKQLMDNANTALKGNSNQEAIVILKKLLNLPPNQQSQAAQFMLGQTFERSGEFAKARAEYDVYIRRYPGAKNLDQVKESLARVFMAAYESGKPVPEKLAVNDKMAVSGNFSQYYNKGLLRTDSTALPSAVKTSFTSSDQSQLLSSLDMTGRKRTETTETRLVFRDTYTANFLSGVANNNFVSAAYFEQASNDQSYLYGAGRLAGAAGGVPSRFDGAWLSRNLNSAWRVNGALGMPVPIPGSIEETKTFSAISLDLTRQWNGNAYLIGQRVGEILDRRAVGVEAHYSGAQSNHTGLLEYDTLFKKLNAGLFQGNWATADGANYTMLIDHHRYLQLTNALLLQPAQTITGLVASGVSTDTLRADALAASPISNQLMIGITKPYSSRLKLGGDIRVSSRTGYEAYDSLNNIRTVIPKSVAYTYSAQVTGNNLLFDNDLGIAGASYTNASTYKAKSLSFSQVAPFRQHWQLSIALQLYVENSNLNVYLRRISTNFKWSYHLGQSHHLEGGIGLVQTYTSSPALDERIWGKYFNFGYRMSF